MNRFTNEKSNSILRNALLPVAGFILVVLLFLYGLSTVSQATTAQQRTSLETALQRDIVHCYATQGYYPPSLAYITEHYGLTYDEDHFYIDYQPVASNLMPNVTILDLEKSS